MDLFCCERLSASMARSLHLSFICIPQSTRALDQGGVEPRQAVSPKALRPWTIPLRYSVGWGLVMNLSDHTDCCGSECKLFHLGACSLNSPRLILVDSGSNVCHAWTFLLSLSMGHCTLVD